MPGVVDRLASATPDWLLAATPPGIAALVVATLIGAEPAGSPLRSVARVACPLGLAAYALTTFMLPRVAPWRSVTVRGGPWLSVAASDTHRCFATAPSVGRKYAPVTTSSPASMTEV